MSERMVFEVYEEYIAVLILTALIMFQYNFAGFSAATMRSKIFNKEFMEKHFKAEHE